MNRDERRDKIIDLIGRKTIATQFELANAMNEIGIPTTQSSVSRDLEEIGIIKVNGFYAKLEVKNQSSNLLSLEMAGENLIVAKCETGFASALALKIDKAKIEEIVGTIAGDDTIFVAVRDKKDAKKVIKKVWETFE
ncbi:MAG: arginine repressor [Pyrinomonadaceae bacterium]|nr:arginine repressor [Pyrinomonadaceae bacterium]